LQSIDEDGMRDDTTKVSRPARLAAGAIFGALLMAAPALAARADFPAATRAYDAGDYTAAAEIWRDLAASCDTRSQTALAGLYHDGLGVPQNDIEALRWYLMAAWGGDRDAQQIAGGWYASGEIVPVDRVRAAFWLTLAAEQGLSLAAERRDAALNARP
jgi:TPR repeat protein